ncbi:MAG: NADH:ubiquinone reductase (Na(+)-transporting) subunit B [Flavobacteriaceae bacterium]|nr:NADH:ubiquinone reductase (Na(+)-transporting) subunit B [Flavobacteriaceae bacterium]
MQFLRNTVDKLKKPFLKGGKLERYEKGFQAIETFLFVPNHTTKHGAHVRDGIDLKRTMMVVVIALIPALLFGMYNVGYQHFSQIEGSDLSLMHLFGYGFWKVLPMIIVSYAVGLGIEFAFAMWRGHDVNEGYLVSGLLIPMIMPIDIPLWMLAISVIFAVVIGKEVFGGTGMNIFNPALLARAFAFFSYPIYMSGDKVWVSDALTTDGMSGATVLGSLAQNITPSYTTMDMFLGFIPGSIGETSKLAILIGAVILIATGIASWRIMLSGIVGAVVTILAFNAVGLNELMKFSVIDHLLVGGFLFAIVFMATDPVSAAQTNRGKWIYGFLVGFFTITIRIFNPAYPEGAMLAILLMNAVAPTIDYYVVNGNIMKRKKRMKTNSLKTA